MENSRSATPLCSVFSFNRRKTAAVKAALPPDSVTMALASFLGAFSDNTRARLLLALLESELCVCDLSKALGMSLSAVSHQLRLLRGLGLVKHRRTGKLVFYSLSDCHVAKILKTGLTHIRE
ncbi:MAG: hypothetical protein A2234_05460 [Elusimicrobia bacterium RIFOXYA2_FULL_58_8]|nr:MAG: hypothetical protein A2285_08725 [Elusimicrobia bacterium RIFOXYA12_FULL_57_11]OGS17341.1 MAG: hypothetical protein A2234_05460 [Elusimicrobia bacterium RIFOXYA2_FULL_58_8]